MEITESSVMNDARAAVEVFKSIQKMGVGSVLMTWHRFLIASCRRF
jgi:hypothetical protein